MELVLLESPYAGNVEKNVHYARCCMRDCLLRGEAPYASHLIYTQPDVLDDNNVAERALGITAGLEWGKKADKTVVYVDLGISKGMMYGIQKAGELGRHVEYRCLKGWANPDVIEEVIRFIVVDATSYIPAYAIEDFDWDIDAYEAGLDSLDIIEIVMSVESAFDIDIADEAADKFRTARDLLEYVKWRIGYEDVD